MRLISPGTIAATAHNPQDISTPKPAAKRISRHGREEHGTGDYHTLESGKIRNEPILTRAAVIRLAVISLDN